MLDKSSATVSVHKSGIKAIVVSICSIILIVIENNHGATDDTGSLSKPVK